MQITCLGAQAALGGRHGGERAVGSCVPLHAGWVGSSFLCPLSRAPVPLRVSGNLGGEESWQDVFLDGSAVHQACLVLKLTLGALGRVVWGMPITRNLTYASLAAFSGPPTGRW